MGHTERAFNELARELFIEIELDGTIKDATPNCFNILGYTKQELIGQNSKEIFQTSEFGTMLSNDEYFEAKEVTVKNKDNSNIYMSVSKNIIKEKRYISMIDITKYKEELERSKRLKRIFERTNDIICSFNVEGEYKFDYISPSIFSNLGVTVEELNKNPMIPLETVHPDDYELHLKKFTGEIENYDQYFETRFRHKDGRYIWFEEYIIPVYNEDGKLIKIESMVRDIQKRKELEQELTYLSYHDVLTGVYNRSYFEKLKKELNEENKPVGVIICDLDNLKDINDNLGHEIGDKLLKSVVKLIQETIDENTIVARIGGDEFIILLENIECKEVSITVKNIKNAIENYNLINSKLPIQLSIGSYYSNNSRGYMGEMFRKADRNMYKNKQVRKVI